MKRILLITIGLSLSLFADFTRDDTKKIVTDNATHLQWQDNADAKNITKKWRAAIDYCEGSSLGGYTDWRLPNINELKSIVDRSKFNPTIVTGFQNVSSDVYWSSTTVEDYKNDAWFVYFGSGYVGYVSKDNYYYYVRCVRDGQ